MDKMFHGKISLKLGASVATAEFCDWVHVGIDGYVLHHKYLVSFHLSPWFSADCPAVKLIGATSVCTKK